MTSIIVTVDEIGGQVQYLTRLQNGEDTVTAFFSPVWAEILNWVSMVRHDYHVTGPTVWPR